MFGRKAINLLGMISWALRRREDGAARVATPTRHLAPPVTLMDLFNEQPGFLGSLKRIGDLLLWVSTPADHRFLLRLFGLRYERDMATPHYRFSLIRVRS
jgi:hypothetical protein